MKRNPRGYHGTPLEVVAFVAIANREMRNYEAIGTWVTTDPEHARCFGDHVYQVEFPDTLKLCNSTDPDDLRGLFAEPALSPSCKLFTATEKKLIKAAFIEAPVSHSFYGKRPYEKVQELFKKTMRKLDKEDDWARSDWLNKHSSVEKYMRKVDSEIKKADELWYAKGSRNKQYAMFLYEYYTSRGYDGLAWENSAVDSGLHKDGRRQSQYLIFRPENLPFSKVS